MDNIDQWAMEDTLKEQSQWKEEKQKQKIMNTFKKFLGEKELKDILKLLKITRIEFTNEMKSIFIDDKKLLKNSKEDNGTNRNIYSELFKYSYYKDTSNLQEKLINFLYPEINNKLKVDFASTIRLVENDTNFSILDIQDERIPHFLIQISEISKNLIERSELLRKKGLKVLSETNNLSEIEKNIKELLSNIKLTIISNTDTKRRLYMYLLFFFQVYYNINEDENAMKCFELASNIELKDNSNHTSKLLEFNFDDIKKYCEDKNINKKINVDEAFKSIDIFYRTALKDYAPLSLEEKLYKNIIFISFFEGIYLSKIEHNKKKLYSYLENYRKSEFLMYVYVYCEAKKEFPKKLIDDFFTFEEKKYYLNKDTTIDCEKKVEFESMEIEDDYIAKALQLLINDYKNMEALTKLVNSYINSKKKHGIFINDQSFYRPIKTFVDMIFQLYFYSYSNFEYYLSLKSSFIHVAEIEKSVLIYSKELLSLNIK